MAAYNIAPYIGAAVESALAQTFTDFELIIVDDGSRDATAEIVQRYSDPRIRFTQRPHAGLPLTLVEGIGLARGTYLSFHDGDDLWSPTKLERHVRFLEQHPAVDLTFSWSRIIDEEGRDTRLTTRLWRGPISFSELLTDNVIGNASALVFRRAALEAAGGIDTALPLCHDFDAWLRIGLLRPGNLHAIPEFLTFYRRRKGQLTSDVGALEASFEMLLAKIRLLAPAALAGVEKKTRSNMQRFFAYGWYQAEDYGRALRYLVQSFQRAPGIFVGDPRNWKMSAAAVAGLLLPSRWHGYLTRAALRATRA
jgi:hypothetical protein